MAMSTIRKAIGTVKDQTSIGIAKVSSNLAPELDIAVVKATSHDDDPSDEKHISAILHLTSISRANLNACSAAVSRRLCKTRDWIVALKSLILVHRLLSDGDPAFREEFHLMNMSDFRDETHSNSWDHSTFIRTFALYLDYRIVSSSPMEKLLHGMDTDTILERMRRRQQMLDRFLSCRPIGMAKNSKMIIIALCHVLRESFQIYADICEIIALLLDRFFYMEYLDCSKSFECLAAASKQIDELASFYEWCKVIGVGRSTEYPEVHRLNAKLLKSLEEFIIEGDIQSRVEDSIPAISPPELQDLREDELKPMNEQPKPIIADLVDLSDESQGNRLDLAIISTGEGKWEPFSAMDSGKTEWEARPWRTALIGTDPFAASLSIPPASYVQMADIGIKQMQMNQEQQIWAQYARQGMAEQGSSAMANGAYFYGNSATLYGMPATAQHYYSHRHM